MKMMELIAICMTDIAIVIKKEVKYEFFSRLSA
jgi:hypothetical protein